MRQIDFTPRGFKQGVSYFAELLQGVDVIDTKFNLVENQETFFTVTEPGTYTIRIARVADNFCTKTIVVQALFPIVTFTETDVDCFNNTYTVILSLTNPTTAGVDVQYGWSLLNDCKTVTNWGTELNLIIPADDVTRYVFVRNSDVNCCYLVTSTVNSPCDVCNLDIINVVFSCS